MPALGANDLFDPASMDAGAVAWVLAASALVLLMTPGVAFFYGGMVRAQHVLGMLMQNLTAMALVSVTWVIVGFTLAFGGGNGWIGDLRFAGLQAMTHQIPGFVGDKALVIPPILFALFQLMFAVITPALITGATADRWKFNSFVAFVPLWCILVYAPIAHWVFSPTGWAARWGVLDFAGGLVVHANSGAAALAMALVLGRRRGWPRVAMRPHNLPFVVLGAAILWFGWFGFNGGSSLRADTVAVQAFLNTNTAAAAALLTWAAVEKLRFGRPTTLGAASGALAGLVAVAPCAGYVGTLSALLIGAAAGVACAGAVSVKMWFRLDDSLDVVGVHLVGGGLGVLALGLFASTAVNPGGADGLFSGGGYDLLLRQAVTLVVVVAYSFGMTYVIGRVLDRVMGNRVGAAEEEQGLDLTPARRAGLRARWDGARCPALTPGRSCAARPYPVLLVAVLVPYTVALLTLWSRTGDDLDAARRERAGLTELRPMTTLLAATADAQTQAVAGDAPDPAPLRAAIAAVDAADAAVGAGLGTDRRWADLRSRLTHLTSTGARGATTYTAFSQVLDLELALLTAVGDASGLAVDPELDAHYLVDATLVRIPAMIVTSGRISDLTLLLERHAAPVAPDTLAVAVGQSELQNAAGQLDDGLRKGFEDSGGGTLGPGLLTQLDRLGHGVARLAPPLSAVGAAPVVRTAVATQDARQQLRSAAVATSAAALDQLGTLLRDRQDRATATRRTVGLVTGAGLAVAAAVLWFLTPRRRDEALDDESSGAPTEASAAPTDAASDGDGQADLLEARELLEARQLLRVGRAVSASREEEPPPAEEDS